MEKIALFAYNGDPLCFVHVLLNALDFHEKSFEVRLVIEGSAAGLVGELDKAGHPLHLLYRKVKEKGLLAGVCRACAQKLGSLEAARQQGLALLEDMSGHPSLSRFAQQGYRIVTF